MMRNSLLSSALPIVLMALLSGQSPAEAAAPANDKLRSLAERYIEMTREDERNEGLPDVSAAAFGEEIASQSELLDELLAVPADALSSEQDIDRRLLIGLLKASIRSAEARRPWENDPTIYLPSRQIGMALEPASSGSAAERAAKLTVLLKQLPERLDHGRRNLRNPPARFTEEAIFQAEGLLRALGEGAPAVVAEAGGAAEELRAAIQDASGALESYRAFLEDDLLPASDGSWVLGEDNYNYIIQNGWFLDEDADAMLERGRKAFAETGALAQQVAERIDPGKPWVEVYEDLKNAHPTADGLKQAYQKEIDAARRFLIDHRVVTLPKGERVITVDTPPAMRRSSPYGTFDSVGPFEEGLLGRLVLTPIEDWMSPEQRAERLRSHHLSWIPIIAVHEAYPGHHVQALKIKENPNLLRNVVRESIFSEGWGLYCEELMFELGFLEGDDVRLTQLRNRLWRAARVILDSQLHTGRIDFEEAVDFLVEQVRFDRYSAELEVGMYLRRPTYVLGYLIGMQEIAAIRDDYFAAFGEPKPLSDFYDRLLRVGAIPPALVREELFDLAAGGR
jgi:uncharacterized protein (DUF885 family)